MDKGEVDNQLNRICYIDKSMDKKGGIRFSFRQLSSSHIDRCFYRPN